ncbi:hypothetical protein VTN00DRAFT_8880 [Thermoascus crustaceus]|uniref:uncharacterized protein n=1 Tax=Thermoascus crustaceus TaxID=5088 RepID=UPI0037428B6E
MSTSKRTIIVTGGASGIGLGITRSLASQSQPNNTHIHISIFDINRTAGLEVLSALNKEFSTTANIDTGSSSVSFSFKHCDVSSWESQAAAFEQVYAEQGRIDVVFANAGITEKGTLLVSEEEREEGEGKGKPVKPDLRTLDVNLVGVIYSVKLAIYYISKNEPSTTSSTASKGSILCTASNAGLYPFPIAPIYSTAKHAIIGLVRSLARSLKKENIQINALAPAVIETNISSDLALFKSMVITPMSTATRAVAQLLADPGLTGKVAELHGENVTFAEPPPYVDENSGRNIEMFWTLGYA